MAIEFREVIAQFVLRSKPNQSDGPSVFSGHEKLFDFYRIPPEILNHRPGSGITTFNTVDGDLVIHWDERTIVPPLKYYSPRQPDVLTI